MKQSTINLIIGVIGIIIITFTAMPSISWYKDNWFPNDLDVTTGKSFIFTATLYPDLQNGSPVQKPDLLVLVPLTIYNPSGEDKIVNNLMLKTDYGDDCSINLSSEFIYEKFIYNPSNPYGDNERFIPFIVKSKEGIQKIILFSVRRNETNLQTCSYPTETPYLINTSMMIFVKQEDLIIINSSFNNEDLNIFSKNGNKISISTDWKDISMLP